MRPVKLFCGMTLGVGLMLQTASWGAVLETVRSRGVLNCGTDNSNPGFGYLNPKTGLMEGLDVDFCRAAAAAVLGDSRKLKFVVVTDKSRFTIVQTHQVDVVFAHTTVEPQRESVVGVDFLPFNFYDGTGVMVKVSSGVKTFAQLEGATLCTTQGSGTETTLSESIAERHWKGTTVLTYENLERLFIAFNMGRCDAMTTDRSALLEWRLNSADPNAFLILPELLDKSPFAGFVAQGDPRWRNILRWVVFALFQAEESGISSTNIGTRLRTGDPFEQKFLGITGSFGKDFGIPNDFVATMVRQVGNYGEIYDRNLGPKTPYFLNRKGTPNALWRDGGLIYSPDWR
jgi:general L-amino acid transport system substrate-binding protein